MYTGEYTQAFKNIHLEVTYVTSAHIPLARTNQMLLSNFERERKCDLPGGRWELDIDEWQ